MIDYLVNSIIPCTITLITALGLNKFIITRYEKKRQSLDNESFEGAEWKKLYEEQKARADEWESRIDKKNIRIDELYNDVNKHRDEKVGLHKQILQLSIENEKLKVMKCEVKGCTKRVPPSEAMK